MNIYLLTRGAFVREALQADRRKSPLAGSAFSAAAYLVTIFHSEEIIMRNQALAKLPPKFTGQASGFVLVPLSALPRKELTWCWPGRIAQGMVTVFAGYQKSGKSLVACNIAATITRGGEFPAGEGEAKRGHVVIINNED